MTTEDEQHESTRATVALYQLKQSPFIFFILKLMSLLLKFKNIKVGLGPSVEIKQQNPSLLVC